MNPKVRRVVTGEGPDGRSRIYSDGEPPFSITVAGSMVADLWQGSGAPEQLKHGYQEATDGKIRLDPPNGGNFFRIVDFLPASKQPATSEQGKAMFEQLGSGSAFVDSGDPRGHMHRTETVDYGIVLSGRMTLVVEDGEVELAPGDIVIQRGCNHLWYNHTTENCRMAFVMIDAVYPKS